MDDLSDLRFGIALNLLPLKQNLHGICFWVVFSKKRMMGFCNGCLVFDLVRKWVCYWIELF